MAEQSEKLVNNSELSHEFLSAMSAAATGVTIVSTDGDGGRFATTVSAMCSVSAEPPLLLCCIHGRSPAVEAIKKNEGFCVNVLATHHKEVADNFAGRAQPGKEAWDFEIGEWVKAKSGAPRLSDSVASFDCDIYDVIEAGTHLIFIGQVHHIELNSHQPLIYTARDYHRPVHHAE